MYTLRFVATMYALCCYWRLELASADEDCKVSGNDFCRCSTLNLTLDLRDIGLPYPAATTDPADKYDLTYMPCQPKVCGDSGQEASVMCQVRRSDNDAFSLGRYANFKWTITKYNPLEFEIHYEGGDVSDGKARKTIVMFKSGTGATVFSFDHEDDKTLAYYFNVVGSRVAPYNGGSSSKGNGGTIAGPIGLAIIFIALGAFIAYFVVGGIYLHTQKGARGMEVIPNNAFWRELPFLIKDGFLFVISPCYRSDKYQGL